MHTKSATDRKDDPRPRPQPAVLTPGETQQVSGGLNPQPLPPCTD